MDLYALRTLRGQPVRLALTAGGVALCTILMLFLLSVYHGVAEGGVGYIRHNRADLWVLQRNAWNILRGSSVLPASAGRAIEATPGVRSSSPVLLLLSGIGEGDKRAIANDAELIIADEPTASLEIRQGLEIIELLHAYARDRKRAVLVASHDLRIVGYADRVLRLEDGLLSEAAGPEAPEAGERRPSPGHGARGEPPGASRR